MLTAKLRLILAETASKPSRYDRDEWNVYDEVGGNIDDAFELGVDEGEILYARQLIELLDVLEEQENAID